MEGIHRVGAVLAAVVVTMASLAGGAAGRQLTLHLRFRDTGLAAAGVATSPRYAFIEASGYPPDGGLGTLIDERTGRRTRLARPGCSAEQSSTIAGPWLVFDCPAALNDEPAPELYSLSSGTWVSVKPASSLVGYCSVDSCSRPISAGSAWLEYAVSDCPMGEHCTGYNEFQSLTSGELRKDPTGGRTIANVNSPALAQQLCEPVQVPAEWYTFFGFGPGSLDMDGQFAIAWGSGDSGPLMAHLERCGSTLDRLLIQGPYANAPLAVGWNRTTVVWQSAPHQLSGLFLPSLRRFRVSYPAAVSSGNCWAPSDCLIDIALTNHTLYLLGPSGQTVWTASAPTLPKKHGQR